GAGASSDAADPAILLAAAVAPGRRRVVSQAREPHDDRRLQDPWRARLSRRGPPRTAVSPRRSCLWEKTPSRRKQAGRRTVREPLRAGPVAPWWPSPCLVRA